MRLPFAVACGWARARLGMDFIRANRETVERAIRDKRVDLDLDALLGLAADVRSVKGEIEALRAPLGRAFAS